MNSSFKNRVLSSFCFKVFYFIIELALILQRSEVYPTKGFCLMIGMSMCILRQRRENKWYCDRMSSDILIK
jgi:hypothetical protein